MTYEQALEAAREGKPVKAWHIDGATKITTVYQRIARVGVWFVEKDGKLVPSEYVELLSAGGGSVTHSGPERCEFATEDELKTELEKREAEWRKKVRKGGLCNGYQGAGYKEADGRA